MNSKFKYIFLLFGLICFNCLQGQAPVNDNCEAALEIVIPNKGFDYGTIISKKINVENATRQKAEHCVKDIEETGNCTKTVWYKFYIPTTRNIAIKLTQQDSSIPQIFAGFNTYKIPDCTYTITDISVQLTPLNKFGVSGNNCLQEGWYLIQVGCKQKAKGELWIELEVNAPLSDKYDEIMGYFDFGQVKDYELTKQLNTECASIAKNEYSVNSDSSLCKSVWVKFMFSNNAIANIITIKSNISYSNQKTSPIKGKFRIFNDTISPDSLNSTKPFIDLQESGIILNEECPDNLNQKKYYLQLILENETDIIYLTAKNYTYHPDPWNNPNTSDTFLLPNSQWWDKTHHYTCDGFLKNHKCKNVIPEYFLRKYPKSGSNRNNEMTADTFKIGGYKILNIMYDGILSIADYGYKSQSNNSIEWFYSALYKGDIRKDCNLYPILDTFIQSTNSYNFSQCIKKGTYTLVTCVMKLSDYAYINQKLELKLPINKNKYYHSNAPEKLNDFNPIKDKPFSSEKITFANFDTTIIVDSVIIKGRMTFKEIYISESSDFNIRGEYASLYLFRGELSKGIAKTIPGIDYTSFKSGFGFYPGFWNLDGECFSLGKGYYTIISFYDNYYYNPHLPCNTREHWVTLTPNNTCPIPNNIEPQFALPINGNQDIFTAPGSKKGLNYEFIMPTCRDCRNSSVSIPEISCRNSNKIKANTLYRYYTFFMSEDAEFRTTGAYELYRGNVMTDQRLVYDSSNIISPCKDGSICNLKGNQTYTIIYFDNSSVIYPAKFILNFTKHIRSSNDFAANAYDFGDFSTTTNRQSTLTPITCHTNGLKTDPYQKYYMSTPDTDYGTNFIIKYKDTPDLKRPGNRKNLWYTFTNSAPSKIKILFPKNTLLNVFQYSSPFNADFKQVLANNFDSTIKSMKYITPLNYRNFTDTFLTFENNFCSTSNIRYFALLEMESYTPALCSIKIINELTTKPTAGDFCRDAATGNFNTYGNYTISTDNTCHTYGNSPFESGSSGLKSTWFKISITNLLKFNLQIKSKTGNGLQGFNVYGGTCKAMSKITALTDRYSYFTISCMGSGHYYIQALYSLSSKEQVAFDVNILKPENSGCKPYDFKFPIALFKIKGGCNEDDTLRTSNLSTLGEDISYQWFLNGKLFSTKFNPFLLRSNPAILDSNKIKLIVSNSAEFTKDTFELVYQKDTTQYLFTIQGTAKALYCFDTLKLTVKTNYPCKINYEWYRYNSSTLSRSPQLIQPNSYNATYYVAGESDNCFFKDSFKINTINDINIYRDTALCQGQTYRITNTSTHYMSIDNQSMSPGSYHDFKISGKHIIYFTFKSCGYYDTINVTVEKGPKHLIVNDTIYTCNVQNYNLTYTKEKLLHYKWSTGDSSPFIAISKNGNYRLRGKFSKCRDLDYNALFTLENINKDLLKDTIVCRNDEVIFNNPYRKDFKLLFKQPDLSIIKIIKPVQRQLKLQKSKCFITDSALVDLFPFEGRVIDSFYCDTTGNFSILLDGGIANKYNWFQDNEFARNLLIHHYGSYPVARIDKHGCMDTIAYNIITNCDFTVFIPNAFTPNDDITNESFGPYISGKFTNCKMSIYNRWGEKIFNTDNNEKWTGYYQNKLVPEGSYSYIITVVNLENKTFTFRGMVSVLY